MKPVEPDLFDALEPSAPVLLSMLESSDQILVKKLSNNDRDWARHANKHQGGVYMPPAQRDSGFFPALASKSRPDPGAPAIRETWFSTNWPQHDVTNRRTRLVHYTSKGPETHMTGLPRQAFATLSPASFLVMARGGEGEYTCLSIDSGTDDATLQRWLGLSEQFRVSR